MLEPVRDDEAPDWTVSYLEAGVPVDGPEAAPEPSAEVPADPEAVGPETASTHRRFRLAPRSWRLLLGAALILAGTTLALIPRIQWQRTLAPVRDAISVASASGPVYPEARTLSPEALQGLEATGGMPPRFQESMSRLRARFDENPRNADVAYWLAAGFTVSGDLKKARATVDIARVHNTHEPRLWILDAILAAREGNTKAAREILGRFLQSYPGNTLATRDLEALP